MQIRELELEDIQSLIPLFQELVNELDYDFSIDLYQLQNHFNEMKLNNEIYRNYVYIENEKIIGFISVIYYRSFIHSKGTALINELIVNKEFRNNKIGSKLINHVVEITKQLNYDELEVGVMKENKEGIKFYKTNNFTEEYLLLGMELEPSS